MKRSVVSTNKIPTSKIVAILGIGMAVGFGTCSVGAFLGSQSHLFTTYLTPAGIVVFFVCLAGLAVIALITLARRIAGTFHR